MATTGPARQLCVRLHKRAGLDLLGGLAKAMSQSHPEAVNPRHIVPISTGGTPDVPEGDPDMNESQTTNKAPADWTALRNSPESPGGGSSWSAHDYSTLVDLIRHCDDQIASANRYHMVAIGGMIPMLAILLKMQVPLFTHIGLLFLTAALGVRWLTLTSKLNMEKLCWVSLARRVEDIHFADAQGPFTAQENFFSNIPEPMNSRHGLVMHKFGTRRLYFVSIMLLAVAVAVAGLAAMGRLFNWPF